jgi:hypothetical protein
MTRKQSKAAAKAGPNKSQEGAKHEPTRKAGEENPKGKNPRPQVEPLQPTEHQTIKPYEETSKIGRGLQQLSQHGTVTVRVRCGGLGFQIKGYYGQPPQPFDLRGTRLAKLIKKGRKLQKGKKIQ